MELVECIRDDGYDQVQVQWIREFPVKGQVYTVRRRVHTSWGMGLLLDEITNPVMPNGAEPNFNRNRFRPVPNDGADDLLAELSKQTEVKDGQLK